MEGSLAGRLLIASPMIEDPRFKQAVILLCAHNEEHAMGIILNKVTDELPLDELLDQLGVDGKSAPTSQHILMGGPVGRDRGFVLHSDDYDSDGATLSVSDGVCLTATRDVLHAIVSEAPPERFVLALGYAGWGAGQLEQELAENIWMVGDPSDAIVFDHSMSTKWSRALNGIGVSPERLQIAGGRA